MYKKLCEVSNQILSDKFDARFDFWKLLANKNVDSKVGTIGSITPFLEIMNANPDLVSINPTIQETSQCRSCTIDNSKQINFRLPIALFDFNQSKIKSIQGYFSGYLSSSNQVCPTCQKHTLNIRRSFLIEDPKLLIFIVDFILISNGNYRNLKNFEYNQEIVNTDTGKIYQLKGIINYPIKNHFNCAFF